MAIALYPHNENAYHAALVMLRETGKAAVIRPQAYRTEGGHSLGLWILTQRAVRKGLQRGVLSEERIAGQNTLPWRRPTPESLAISVYQSPMSHMTG